MECELLLFPGCNGRSGRLNRKIPGTLGKICKSDDKRNHLARSNLQVGQRIAELVGHGRLDLVEWQTLELLLRQRISAISALGCDTLSGAIKYRNFYLQRCPRFWVLIKRLSGNNQQLSRLIILDKGRFHGSNTNLACFRSSGLLGSGKRRITEIAENRDNQHGNDSDQGAENRTLFAPGSYRERRQFL